MSTSPRFSNKNELVVSVPNGNATAKMLVQGVEHDTEQDAVAQCVRLIQPSPVLNDQKPYIHIGLNADSYTTGESLRIGQIACEDDSLSISPLIGNFDLLDMKAKLVSGGRWKEPDDWAITHPQAGNAPTLAEIEKNFTDALFKVEGYSHFVFWVELIVTSSFPNQQANTAPYIEVTPFILSDKRSKLTPLSETPNYATFVGPTHPLATVKPKFVRGEGDDTAQWNYTENTVERIMFVKPFRSLPTVVPTCGAKFVDFQARIGGRFSNERIAVIVADGKSFPTRFSSRVVSCKIFCAPLSSPHNISIPIDSNLASEIIPDFSMEEALLP